MTEDFCEYCDGFVQPKVIKSNVFRRKSGYVILENVEIGVCTKCHNKYYSARVLQAVADVEAGRIPPDRMESVPVAHMS